MHVPLNYVLFSGFHVDLFIVPRQVDAPALACSYWLNDKSFGFLVSELLLEISGVRWQNPRFWEKVILIKEYLLHPFQIPAQQMLVGQILHPRVVVDPLVSLHLLDSLRLHHRV